MNTFSFDGFGINDSDEYRSRLATLTAHGKASNAGPLLAAAPDLLEALQTAVCIMKIQRDIVERGQHSNAWDHPIGMCETAISQATQQ